MGKIIIDKDWCLRMAELEGDTEICAGMEENRDFFAKEAWEQSQEVARLKDELDTALSAIADRDYAIQHLSRGVDFEKTMPNETRPTIRAALEANPY